MKKQCIVGIVVDDNSLDFADVMTKPPVLKQIEINKPSLMLVYTYRNPAKDLCGF